MTRFSLALVAIVCGTWVAAGEPEPARDGLRVWLDASAEGALEKDETGRLVRWRNRIEGGPTAEADVGRGPVPVARGMNGKPVLRFTGAEWLRLPALRPSVRPVAVFVVAQRRDQGWTLVGPLPDPPKRITDRWPLSDQANRDGWQPDPDLTDEFTGDRLDEAKWWPTNPKWLGRQPALFHPSNVRVADGELQLTMRRWFPEDGPTERGYHTYTSAAVQSRRRVLYGYFEVEAQPMRSHGSSAFWFYDHTPEIWTEIDVFEIGGGAPGHLRRYHMNAHVFHTPEERRHWNVGGTWEAPWDLADDFHVYGLQWDREELKYYVDGVLVRRMPNTHWHQPLTLNLDSETMPNWFGLPRDEDLPSTFRIRYVRAWKHPDGEATGGPR